MIYLIITILIVGVFLYFVNQARVPLPQWVKWLINAICVIGLLLYAANVLFGYTFPGAR